MMGEVLQSVMEGLTPEGVSYRRRGEVQGLSEDGVMRRWVFG